MSNILLFYISILFCYIKISFEYYMLVDLDNKVETNNINFLSKYLKDIFQDLNTHVLFTGESNYHVVGSLDLLAKYNASFSLGDEDYNIIINNINFRNEKDKNVKDYVVYSNIDSNIIPNNYFDGINNDKKKVDKFNIKCYYSNRNVYKNRYELKMNLSNIVYSNNFNYGIDFTGKLKVFSINSKKLFKIEDINQYTDIKIESNYLNLFLSNPNYCKFILLFGLTNNKTINIFNINEKINYLNITSLGYIQITDEINNITKISHNEKNIFIASEIGLLIYDINTLKKEILIDEYKNITDILVNKKTVYVLTMSEKFKGLKIFNLKNFSYYSEFHIEHPYFYKFDYVLFENKFRKSTYFIGITVDNTKENGINELLIELIANDNFEFSPKLNRIYITRFRIDPNDIITDRQNYFTYAFDKNNNFLFLLTRGNTFFQKSFSYKLEKFLNYNQKVTKFYLLSNQEFHFDKEENPINFPYLAAFSNEKNYFYLPFSRKTQSLICNINKPGDYVEHLIVGNDCSKYNKEKKTFEVSQCLIHHIFPVYIESVQNWITRNIIWIIIGVFLGFLFFMFIYCLCCRNKERKGFVQIPQSSKLSYIGNMNKLEMDKRKYLDEST